jgi:phospholipase C
MSLALGVAARDPEPLSAQSVTAAATPLSRINHIIVIYQENRSFDSLYAFFPGANGANNWGSALPQVDKNNVVYPTLPQPLRSGQPDPRFPNNLANMPFDVSRFVAPSDMTGDMVHRYYQEQFQIDGGKMDKFVAFTDAAGLVMGYYDATSLPEGQLARQYTMADNFFHAAFGGSFLNHFWLVCACSPTWPNAPSNIVAQLDANGNLIRDGQVTPDGFAVNTSFTVNTPHPSNITDTTLLVPNQTLPNIGDRLSNRGISWAWFSGGWNDALAGHPDPLFQFHHQPFAFFANYADGTLTKKEHLRDEADFFASLSDGTLPSISFIKPLGPDNEHPGYANLTRGQQHVADIVAAVQASPFWDDSLIVVTYDEHGGSWDHVAPPVGDRWGPGSRVPTVIISPFAKRGFVDHTRYDTTAILKTIENRWNLAPLGTRDAAQVDLSNALTDPPAPAVGGRGLTISSDASGTLLNWQGGTSQAGFNVLRMAGNTTSTIATLGSSATSYVDSNPPSGVACYAVQPFGASQPGISDLECAVAGFHSTTGAPLNFALKMNQSNIATLSWNPPAGGKPTNYLVATLGGPAPQTVSGNQTSTTIQATGPVACAAIAALDTNGNKTGNTDFLCGVKGMSTFAAGDPARAAGH